MESSAEHSGVWNTEPVTDLPSRPGRLRALALEADAGSERRLELASLWGDMTSGRAIIEDVFFTERRCLLVLKSSLATRPDRRLEPRRVQLLERILLGRGQKSLAVELGVAPSTVTLIAGECLRAMGVDCPSSRVPLPLAMAAHARRSKTAYPEGLLSRFRSGGVDYSAVGMDRPDQHLEESLSPAERAVARLLIEGLRHAEIALLRQTSERTIANQLAAAFHKIGVSGRAELLCRLINPALDEPRLARAERRRPNPRGVAIAAR